MSQFILPIIYDSHNSVYNIIWLVYILFRTKKKALFCKFVMYHNLKLIIKPNLNSTPVLIDFEKAVMKIPPNKN